ncbi:MAG TPA: hypothetical protein VIJ72_02250 [Rhizomicrobium sp.]
MLRAFPMLLIVVILYNFIAFGGGVAGHHDIAGVLAHGVSIPMFSKDIWTITLGDGLMLLGLAMLFVETVRATRNSSRELLNHGLSMLTFVIALVEFITLKGFSTSVFFFILAMTLFDVVAGYTISTVAAKHDLSLSDGHH